MLLTDTHERAARRTLRAMAEQIRTGQIRIGLIGYGDWARTAYLPALEADGRARVVAVAAPSAASRQRAARELGPAVTVCAGAGELLAAAAVDGVMVAVSEAAHAAAIGAALDAGTAVFYEGPLAASRQAIPGMIDRLLRARGPTHADIELGFLPVVRRAAELVAGGTVGVPQLAEVRLESDWGALPEEDLCKLDHLAPWYVDPLDRVLGRTAGRVLTMDGAGSADRAQAQGLLQLDYDGCWGTFAVNTGAVAGPDMRLAVTGTAGDVRVDLLTGQLRWRSAAGPAWTTERWAPIEPIVGLPGMHECVRAFLDCIDPDCIESAAEGAAAEGGAGRHRVARLHRLGLAAERSRDTGTWAAVEPGDSGESA